MNKKELKGLIKRTQKKVGVKIKNSKEEDLTKLNEDFRKDIEDV